MPVRLRPLARLETVAPTYEQNVALVEIELEAVRGVYACK